jgi:hypothetical protein
VLRPLEALILLTAAGAAGAQELPVDQVPWRYDEDWSVLRGRAVDDPPWWLPAKYVPLDRDGRLWLSSGLEARARYEGFRGNEWGSAGAPDDGYLWLRFFPHLDVHAGPVRAFVQGIGGYAIGVEPAAGPADETGIDLLQGFADIRIPIGSEAAITLRGGRELMALGSERLIGTRYGPNIPQPFDGVRAIADLGPVRVNAFWLRPVRIGPGDFDDASDGALRLAGAYLTLPLRIGRRSGLDAYFLDYHRDLGRFDQGEAEEDRQTWGARFFGRSGNWAWNWEAMLQTGRFGGGRIHAWSIASETSRDFPNVPLRPSFRLRANIVSGDPDPADPDLGTFNPLFPKGNYFGELSPIGPYNIVNLHPDVTLDFGRGFGFSLAGVAYWRESRRDGVYNMPGQLIRSGQASRAAFVGAQAEAVLSWQPDPALSMAVSYSIMEPGEFIEESGPSRTIHMIGLETRIRL